MARILNDLTTSIPDAETAALGYAVCDWDDKAALAAYIDTAWAAFCERAQAGSAADVPEGPGNRTPRPDVSRYSRRNTAAAMARLLDGLCPKKDNPEVPKEA